MLFGLYFPGENEMRTNLHPQVWCEGDFLEALGLPYFVIERNGTLLLVELKEQEVPVEWFDEAVIR